MYEELLEAKRIICKLSDIILKNPGMSVETQPKELLWSDHREQVRRISAVMSKILWDGELLKAALH